VCNYSGVVQTEISPKSQNVDDFIPILLEFKRDLKNRVRLAGLRNIENILKLFRIILIKD
jgi:hypothetical protein